MPVGKRGVVLFLLVLAGLSTLAWIDPARSVLFPRCPLHMLTGLHCPGCGSQRALHQLLNGNLGRALALNPLLVVSLPVLALLALWRPLCYRAWVPWLALTVLLAYGIARNLPAWPFSLLAPH
jgi:hypothetical protein